MQEACTLLSVPALPAADHRRGNDSTDASSGRYDNASQYYLSKAPLILEESRFILAEAVGKELQKPRYSSHGSAAGGRSRNGKDAPPPSSALEVESVEEQYPKLNIARDLSPLVVSFRGGGSEWSDGTRWTRPGSVFLLRRVSSRGGGGGGGGAAVLGHVMPLPRGKKSKSFDGNAGGASVISLMVFRRSDLDLAVAPENNNSNASVIASTKIVFQVTGLTTLVGQVRQMEACLRMSNVPFMSKLLGQKGSTHIRFDDSDEEEEEVEEEKKEEEVEEEKKEEEEEEVEENNSDMEIGSSDEEEEEIILMKEPATNSFSELEEDDAGAVDVAAAAKRIFCAAGLERENVPGVGYVRPSGEGKVFSNPVDGDSNDGGHGNDLYCLDRNRTPSSSSMDNQSNNPAEAATTSSSTRLLEKLPKLNSTQEVAANTFLESPWSSLTLVQG